MPEDTSIATRAARRAMEFQERMKARIRQEFALSIGRERVSTRHVRDLARQGLREGRVPAELTELAAHNGHDPANEKCPCPVCRECNHVLAEHRQKQEEDIVW